MFGFKKKSVDKILAAIEKLSDEDRKSLISSLNGESPQGEPPESELSAEETASTAGEQTDEQTTSEPPASDDLQGSSDTAESEVAADEDPAQEETSEPGVESTPENAEAAESGTEQLFDENSAVQGDSVPDILPADTPTENAQAQNPADNSQELFAAQNAKIEALESQIAAMQEMLDNIVSAADQQNFGSSPQADFDDEERSSRYSSVLQNYAGRRARNYQ